MSMADRTTFQYWVKSSLSLRYVKDALVNIANERADSLKNNINKDVEARCKAAVQSVCTKCTWNSVNKNNKSNGCAYYMSCNICNHWLTMILKHAKPNHKLEWSNCDPQKWPTRGWEITKVFMGYGCDRSRNAEDIDCSNLMTMMLGCTYFHHIISGLQILQEIKEIRNTVMHSGSLELSEGEMKTNLNKMIELLEDPVCFKLESTCQEAVDKIKKLRDDTLTVTLSKEEEYAEINGMIGELRKEITDLNKKKDLISTNVLHLANEQESFWNSHQDLKDGLQDSMTLIERKQERCQTLLDTLQASELPDIKLQLQTMIGQLLSMREDTNYDVQRLQDKYEAMDLKQKQLEQRQDRAEKQIISFQQKKDGTEQNITNKKRLIEDRKKGLQSRLLDMYNEHCSRVPVYALRPQKTHQLDALYVTPTMIEMKLHEQTQYSDISSRSYSNCDQEESKIETLKDIFFKESMLCKNIYVTGEAGVGKSTFCINLVNLWCKVQLTSESNSYCDLETMKQFPLLFYIHLSGMTLDTAYNGDVFASIIEKQLGLDMSVIKEALQEERCLIIADALDESVSGEPKRAKWNKSTVIITSRAWKIEALRYFIEGDAIDKHILIAGIDQHSAKTLADRVISILDKDSKSKSMKSVQLFFEEINRKRLETFLKVPVLLIQMLCLWHKGLSIGDSNSSIYGNLVHHQIMAYVIQKKGDNLESFSKYSPLRCKTKHCPCNNFSDIINKVGQFAFDGLLNKSQESENVFSHYTREMHIDICLKIGILTQHKLSWELSDEPIKYVGFVHKTYQEYFASIYLAHEDSDIKLVLNPAIVNLDKMLEFERVLMFISGLHPEKGLEMATILQEAAEADPRVHDYRQTAVSRHDDLISNVQNAILAAMEECWRGNNKQLKYPLIDIIVDKENMSQVSSRISRSSHIASLRILGNIATDNLLPLIDTSRLQKVDLLLCTISRVTVTQLIPSSLCALYLDGVRLSHNDLSALCSQLAAAENLRDLLLFELECEYETHRKLDDARCEGLSLDLGRQKELRKLYIANCHVSALDLTSYMSHLQEVFLYGVTTTAVIVRKLVDRLPRNNVKVTLYRVTIRHEEDAPSLDAILDNIRRSCKVVDDDSVRRKENGDLWVKWFVFRI